MMSFLQYCILFNGLRMPYLSMLQDRSMYLLDRALKRPIKGFETNCDLLQ